MSQHTEKPNKRTTLENLTFGARVAEEERESLADYFVETDQWRKVSSGEVDVIFGPKGSGKSAIYTTLMSRASTLADSGTLLMSAERPRGNTVFQGLVSSPPTAELEFVSLWKLYLLSLVGSAIADWGMEGENANKVRSALYEEGLLEAADAPLNSRFKSVWDWVKRALSHVSSEGELKIDPVTANPTGVSLKISLSEPSAGERSHGYRSLDDLLAVASAALADNDFRAWVLFDRLDVAFAESRELEANGIRALFKTYLDIQDLDRISLKIFLRSDIWSEVTNAGFREASHITRQLRIEWGKSSLLNLVVRRALNSANLRDFYDVSPEAVLKSVELQRKFFDRIVPDKVDVGKNPNTFEWILGRVQDATRQAAPREVIHLLNEARDAQLRMMDRGEGPAPGNELIGRSALREALLPVSKVRLEQTIYAEYAISKPWIQALEGEKSEHTHGSLAQIWQVSEEAAAERVQRLVEIGFMESRGEKSAPTFWIPFLYRPALRLRQGAALDGGYQVDEE